ncbi:MAG: cell division protein YceG involved in septum cleavage [Patiriisocius sp.]|jgi:cell division protein YceG involved in septum cleavage
MLAMHLHSTIAPASAKKLIRITYVTVLFLSIISASASIGLLHTKEVAFSESVKTIVDTVPSHEPFPVSVYPREKTIVENTKVDTYLNNSLSLQVQDTRSDKSSKEGWLRYIIAEFAALDWYQNLASPHSRILIVRAGARTEEVTKRFGDILNWDAGERTTFSTLINDATPNLDEGTLFPAHYLVEKGATPETVATILIDRFNTEILARYTQNVTSAVPLQDALVIASMLEREAYDFTDMREISGVIWNRLFIDMKLQIDATLQYAKGTTHVSTWYPPVIPDDKYIDSPFNTYQNKGLPPQPIGNPSTAAVLAALNPVQTECLFYFHDLDSQFHCTPTYKEHVEQLKVYYGQGK